MYLKVFYRLVDRAVVCELFRFIIAIEYRCQPQFAITCALWEIAVLAVLWRCGVPFAGAILVTTFVAPFVGLGVLWFLVRHVKPLLRRADHLLEEQWR